MEWPLARAVEPDEELRVHLLAHSRYLVNRHLGSFTLVLQQLVNDGSVSVFDSLVDASLRPLAVS